LAALRERNAERIANRRREAEEAQRLLRLSVERKINAERERHGLVIVEALYGKIPQRYVANSTCDEVFDVTIAIQALVHDSQLIIPGGRSKV
jgi:DnaJ family protein C protein 11